MPYVNTDVWVDDPDLEDFDEDELIKEIESRGYKVLSNTGNNVNIGDLYNDYMTLSKESFDKKLKKFFLETLDVYVR
jgi:hypothetical protein